nr:hypothetical protein [uncultured Roseateles sp.]
MSFSSNRKAVFDESLPLAHRASHARSCALHVANKLGVPRSAVFVEVARRTRVDLDHPASVAEVLRAFALLEELRQGQALLASSHEGG